MAQKKSQPAEGSNIRRIKAKDDNAAVKPTKKHRNTSPDKNSESKIPSKSKTPSYNKPTRNPLKAFVNYLKGAWYELRQVRWPNRSATWSMTLAVLIFTAIFVVIIVLLDTTFNWLFEQLLK